MNINNLSLDTAKAILGYLIDSDKITKDDLTNALKFSLPNGMKRIVDAIHTTFCLTTHEIVIPTSDKGYCKYYDEETLEDCWQQSRHEHWTNETTKILQELDISDENIFFKTLSDAKFQLEQLKAFETKNPKAFKLMLKLLGSKVTT